ncbi:hypothetical protein ACKWTF_000592 [Chironomus riparius]
MFLSNIFVAFACFAVFQPILVNSKVIIIFYNEINNCEDYCKGDECFEFYDLSTLRVISDEEDETVAYLNGTWKFNTDVHSPEKALAWAEKRHGSKWSTEALYHRYNDACEGFRNPLDPVYSFFRGKQGCPHKKGESISWNMHKIVFPPTIASSFVGEWRANVAVERVVDGKLRKQCKYLRYDIHDE